MAVNWVELYARVERHTKAVTLIEEYKLKHGKYPSQKAGYEDLRKDLEELKISRNAFIKIVKELADPGSVALPEE